jgi:hypothetical protein
MVFVTTEQCSPIVAPLALRRAVAVLIVVMIADVMDLLDSTIANLAGRRSAPTSVDPRRHCSGCSRPTP